MSNKTKITVADYVSNQLDVCGKMQAEVAKDCGFNKPNIITMIKQGKTKLPLDKVGLMARSMNVDSFTLLKLAMEEYNPGAWAVVEQAIQEQGHSLVMSEHEQAVVAAMRSHKRGLSKEDVKKIVAFVNDVKNK